MRSVVVSQSDITAATRALLFKISIMNQHGGDFARFSVFKPGIKFFSNKALSNDEVKLLSRDLKFIPIPPVPSSDKSSLKDFNNFARTMRLKYMFASKRKLTLHLPSMLNPRGNHLSKTPLPLKITCKKQTLKLASVVFRTLLDNISASVRTAIDSLKPREDEGKRGNLPYRPYPHRNPSEVIFREYRIFRG